MNLIIDIGNSSAKVDIYEKKNCLFSKKIKKLQLPQLIKFIDSCNITQPIDGAIMSSVSYIPEDIVNYLEKKHYFIQFSEKTAIPIKNMYKTPQMLGKDRLAAAVGANHIFPKNNVLVIDIGTCIKYDFINNMGEYLGGAISPGYDMRLKALHYFTDRLPLLKKNKKKHLLIGENTEDSILSGVYNGISSEINYTILKYQKKYAQLKIVLSGGAMKNLHKELKISIFAIPNIVTFGLNIILEYNKSLKD